MKTKEELNALKNEVEALNAKLTELTEEELEQVTGGCYIPVSGFPLVQDEEALGDQTLGGLFNSCNVIQEREGRLGYGWQDKVTP